MRYNKNPLRQARNPNSQLPISEDKVRDIVKNLGIYQPSQELEATIRVVGVATEGMADTDYVDSSIEIVNERINDTNSTVEELEQDVSSNTEDINALNEQLGDLEVAIEQSPGTLADLDNGPPVAVTGDAFPNVLSIDNSRGPVLALNESITDLAQRDEWLKAQIEDTVTNLQSESGAQLIGFKWPIIGSSPATVAAQIIATKVIPFELLGGVGDGNYLTGSGTDNLSAFALAQVAGEAGYTVKFASNAQYKTTAPITIHNMRWIGDADCTPIIFGWFSTTGRPVIGRNTSAERKRASIDGLSIWRCGPNPEHGITIDNMAAFDLRAKIYAVPNSNGGAVSVSAFYSLRRPSEKINIDCYITQSGDYGVQFGDVNDATVAINAKDCYREIFGLEPIIRDVFVIPAASVSGNTITVSNHGLKTGDPLIYSPQGNTAALPRSAYYFAIVLSENTFQVADTQYLARTGVAATVSAWTGSHWIIRCGVTDNITLLPSTFVDDNSVRPPLFANTTGYLILTGNSGGWVGTVNIVSPMVDGRRDATSYITCGIRLEGVQGVTVKDAKIRGCHQGIRILNGNAQNFVNAAGVTLTSVQPIILPGRDNTVIAPVVEDFGQYGIYGQHGPNNFSNVSARSLVAGATAINDQSTFTNVYHGAECYTPNGTTFTYDVGIRGVGIMDMANGRVVDRSSRYYAKTKPYSSRAVISGGVLASMRSALNSNNQYAGTVTVFARSSDITAGETARYVLEVTKAATSVSATVVLIRSSGLTNGAAPNFPSFTFSMVGDDLIPTAVASTSTTNPFYFYVETEGAITYV